MRAVTPFSAGPRAGTARSFGILSTYPPTACGLATFAQALTTALVGCGASVGVVRIADGPTPADPRLLGELENGTPSSVAAAARRLNLCDVAIVQHEYGIYGGVDGDEVLEIMRALTVPSIAVAHTVLRDPTPHQRFVLEAVTREAAAVVVMTEAARARLVRGFDIDERKITTIPHGAATPACGPGLRPAARPTLLTWGLIGRGKGLEWMIDAMRQLKDLRPRPRYLIAGRTHPKVLAAEGEQYRESLVARSWANGVASSVRFDSGYRDVASLTRLIQQAAVVVLPYDSRDQVTSGVLVDAVAAGRPVVATAFPHAVELLASGAGMVVPHGDADALADALRHVLTEPGVLAAMAAEAAAIAPSLAWPAVADQYARLGDRLLAGLLSEVSA